MKRILIFILSVLFVFFVSVSCSSEKKPATRKVLTLGIRHESNTFSTLHTSEADFNVLRGDDALKNQLWAKEGRKRGIEFIPTLHAYAWPGGVVEKKAFDQFKDEILEGIRHAGALDGIYMDMHGALHVEGYADAQVTLIKEIRAIVGPDLLISGSFDLHGNLSPDFTKHMNLITAYRTAPHRDAAETKVRAVTLLSDALENNLRPHIECIAIPVLVPGEMSITEAEPLHSIYAQIPGISMKEGLMDASIFAGYCWADLPRSAMRVFVIAEDKKYAAQAKAEAERLAREIWDRRNDFALDVPSGSIDEMILKAAEYTETVFISDSGDNTTAGAPGDNVQVLEALIRHKVKDALVAGIVDSEVLQKCRERGLNKSIELDIGGKFDRKFGKPLTVQGNIIYLSPDSLIGTGRDACILDVQGIKAVILNSRRSFICMKDFEDIGLAPLDYKIVIVKLGYLYPELRDIAPVHLMALTSGFCNLDMRRLPFTQVNRPVYPLDLDMIWEP